MKRRLLCLVLLAALLLPACANDQTETESGETEPAAAETAEEAAPEPEEEIVPDLPADLDFGGQEFTFGVVDNQNARNFLVMEEITGEALNDAQYEIIGSANDALNVVISQNVLTNSYPAANALIPFITAGDDVIQVANVFCVDAATLLPKGYCRSYDDVQYIDLSKPYWDQSVNDSLTLAGMRYAAIGDLSISTHDLTYILLFSQNLVEVNQLESPYTLVFEGKWTMDKMNELMETVMLDANGNGERDEEDVFGYLGANKMVLPSFWIGAGEKTMEYDENGAPALAMEDERFISVFEKIFAITVDNGARLSTAEDSDVPSATRNMFAQGHSLFLDCSLFWVSALRDMETDFGIIPYPKYDDAQEDYCSRVSYYMPPIIPVTSTKMDLVGAVLEETNYLAKKKVTPAYYEISLKGKYARDPESISMLDLIFSHRVIDLGDTLFCSNVRDGFVASMYSSDNRNVASTVSKQSKVIGKTIEKLVEAVTSAGTEASE